jgi:exodeoxyribonuclease V alpha subunit
LVVIEGTVEEIIFCNEINGYTVCDIRCGSGEVITAVGYMPFVNEGETLKVTGSWVMHPDYGKQLKAEMYEKLLPQTTEAVEKYLASGVIKGVGPATAAKIVERFGKETLDIIQFRPELLSDIKGISLNKALKIADAFNMQKELRTVVMFFQQYGISPVYSAKIFKVFGEKAIEEIKANPYKLADRIFGIGFKTADRIAMSIGIDPSSKYRICSGIKFVLSQAASSGHTFIPVDKLKEYTSRLLGIGLEDIQQALVALTIDKSVCTEISKGESMVYLSSFYQAELNVCRRLIELSMTDFTKDLDRLDERLERVQTSEGIVLAERQKTAIREALKNGVLVITGGPGTGKTTIIKSILQLLTNDGFEVALAAPTGRAAKRMTEATGCEASTIHRLLEIGYSGDEDELLFNRTEYNPIDADVIIIDEVSMVDILLMNHLLKAIKPGTRLVLVGDVNQLPSVGPGNVLKDIISCGMIKTVRLTEIFRRAGESMITVNAHRINSGEYPHLNEKGSDFFFVSRRDADSIVKTVVELCRERLPKTYGYDPLRHIQVLTPTRKGPAGVKNLNIELQKALNPEDKRKNEIIFRDYTLREGDRVMQVKNNYNLKWEKVSEDYAEGVGIFNGDMGLIHHIDSEEQLVRVLFDDERIVEYDFSILDQLEPAFASTIHKSQGSEYPVVIIPVFNGPPVLMTRNLLYTAVTRAKNLVVLVGMEEVLRAMIENERETLRYSGLCGKLEKYFMQLEKLCQGQLGF